MQLLYKEETNFFPKLNSTSIWDGALLKSASITSLEICLVKSKDRIVTLRPVELAVPCKDPSIMARNLLFAFFQ